jgi:hypothetical protein
MPKRPQPDSDVSNRPPVTKRQLAEAVERLANILFLIAHSKDSADLVAAYVDMADEPLLVLRRMSNEGRTESGSDI